MLIQYKASYERKYIYLEKINVYSVYLIFRRKNSFFADQKSFCMLSTCLKTLNMGRKSTNTRISTTKNIFILIYHNSNYFVAVDIGITIQLLHLISKLEELLLLISKGLVPFDISSNNSSNFDIRCNNLSNSDIGSNKNQNYDILV